MDNCDVISRLPHDLLISILSRLKFKEAMMTSVLSRRWEKLWTFYHGVLVFEISKKLQQNGCSNYARLVNKVMDTLELVESGGMLDSFIICFNLCPDNLTSVHRWVHFALEKRSVKSLTFDNYFYFRRSGCSHHSLAYDFPPLQCSNSQQWNIGLLMSLCFKRVNVSGEVIEHFISNCPLLQSLYLIESHKPLIHLRISGETLPLRRLFISRCPDLTDVELYAPNLVSLIYQNSETTNANFDIRNVPKLEELSIGIWSKCPLVSALAFRLFSCFRHIQKLELDIHRHHKEPMDFTRLPELTCVKYLTMKFSGLSCGSILAWTPLVKTFPDLQKFTLHMIARVDVKIKGQAGWHETFPHKHLKVLEIFGFGRSSDDIELVTRFLKNMPSIEKILLLCDGGGDGTVVFENRVKEAVGFAKELKQMIPEEVNLAINTPSLANNFWM